MEYLNLETSFLMSAEFRGCEPVDRATWLSLSGFCALMENGGRVDGARLWKRRRCEMTLGVTRAELHRTCDLWSWEGDTLIVHFYPIHQEDIVRKKRGVARLNGQHGGRPPKTGTGSDIGTDTGTNVGFQNEPTPEPISEPKSESVKEGKQREGKERESECAREEDPLAGMARRIVDAYPRRERVADALGIVLGHLKAGEPSDRMLAGTHAAALAIAQAPSGALNRFIPSAVSYFSGKRWQDDPATLFRAPEKNNGKGSLSDEELALQLGPRGAAETFGY